MCLLSVTIFWGWAVRISGPPVARVPLFCSDPQRTLKHGWAMKGKGQFSLFSKRFPLLFLKMDLAAIKFTYPWITCNPYMVFLWTRSACRVIQAMTHGLELACQILRFESMRPRLWVYQPSFIKFL